ncbi:MAG TPA: DUF4395 family protein [Anaeromyxobacteraceae bacterium]|jgi:hypothetical protein
MPAARTADPYRDLDVIDSRAPRAMQGFVALVAIAALATGLWPLLALPALQLTLTLRFGRKWCLPCRLYYAVIQPRLGEGPVEDARPPRFANQLGALFLWGATVLHAAGLDGAGNAIAILVAALALVSSTMGLCVGCIAYRVGAQLRGVRARSVARIDLAELGGTPGGDAVVQFTHPLCADCQELERKLRAQGRAPLLVDVSRRPDLARKYGVGVVPFALSVRGDGSVAGRVH